MQRLRPTYSQFRVLRRCMSNTSTQGPKVCIVGSGPAGYYTAQHILKHHSTAKVDVIERLPVPFGLVRFGVAPDHPEVKNVINTFTQTASDPRCSFLGNVTVGKDVSLEQLRQAYHAVIMAYGSPDDKKLGIPGEDLPNVLSARSFVGWYNGLPENAELSVDLDTETAVVLGQGNVAIDAARVLLTPIDILAKTDITEYSLEALRHSRVKRVFLVGRRGPLQVAFTTAELREMTKLPHCRTVMDQRDFEGLDKLVKEIPRPRKRLTELMIKTAAGGAKPDSGAQKEWHLKFLRSPVEVLASPQGNVETLRLGINRLEGPLNQQKAVPTGETEDLSCGLVLRSIGYQSVPIDPCLPFDSQQHIIPNDRGRATDMPGLYCSGWVKRGPVGVIASTMTDAFETGSVVVEDLSAASQPEKPGREALMEALKEKDVQVVEFADWQKIDEYEINLGQERGKPREKLVSITSMLQAAS